MLRRHGDAPLGRRRALAGRSTSCGPVPGDHGRDTGRAARRGRRCPHPAPGTGSAYVRLEYRRQMEIAVVGATAVRDDRTTASVGDARIAITALAPTIRRVAGGRSARWPVPTAETRRSTPRPRAAAAESAPISDVRASADYRIAMAEVVARRAIAAALARARRRATSRSPRATRCYGDLRRRQMKVRREAHRERHRLSRRDRTAPQPA